MVCPICELRVEEFDENSDGATRYVCCRCKALITVQELPDKSVCDDRQD